MANHPIPDGYARRVNKATTSWELRARRAEANLAALDVAVQGISGVLALDSVLQLIVDHVRDLAEAEYAALGIASADGVIERFITGGLSAAARERIGALPRGHGLLGLIIREGRTFRIPDLALDPRRHGFPPHHPEMHSFLGVPITVRGRAVGDLYLTNKRGAPEFSVDDQPLVERFAAHAGLAIENARLSDQVQALAVVEERERIGRDLHDGIIQRIYGVTLGLDDVPEIAVHDPAAAGVRVEHAIDSLHDAIAEIRTFIYGLRPGLDYAGQHALGPGDPRRGDAPQHPDADRGDGTHHGRPLADDQGRAAEHRPRGAEQRRPPRRRYPHHGRDPGPRARGATRSGRQRRRL